MAKYNFCTGLFDAHSSFSFIYGPSWPGGKGLLAAGTIWVDRKIDFIRPDHFLSLGIGDKAGLNRQEVDNLFFIYSMAIQPMVLLRNLLMGHSWICFFADST